MPLEKCFHCGGDMRPGEDKTCTGRAIHADDDICEIYREQARTDRDAKLAIEIKDAKREKFLDQFEFFVSGVMRIGCRNEETRRIAGRLADLIEKK